MIDAERLKEFYAKRFGWITPEGELVVCSMHEHYRALGEKYSQRYKELIEDHEREMYSILNAEQAGLGEDEYYHPAMHRFDPDSDARHDLEDELYSAGFVRLGSLQTTFEAYGAATALEGVRPLLDCIFEMGNYDRLLWTEHGRRNPKFVILRG